RKADERFLARVYMVDVLRLQPRLDLQIVDVGHDFHDRVAGLDDAADSVGGELMDDAGSRRMDLDAVEQVARGNAALNQFGFLALGLAEVLHDLGPEILVDADNLKLSLADLGFCLRDRGEELSAFAVDPRGFPLQRGETRERHQPLVVEILDAGKLALDQLQLFASGTNLHLETGNLFGKLRDLALQQVFLAVACGEASLEQTFLRGEQALDRI